MQCLKHELIYKRFTSLFLLVLFFTQAFSQLIIVADYYHNESQYAAVCENKATPSMHCDGKCQMYKNLDAKDQKDQPAIEKKYTSNETLILLDYFYSLNKIYFANPNLQPIEQGLFFPPTPVHRIFHPPGKLVFS